MQMTGNTILITGGGSGIGRRLAEEFHKLGNQVIITGRSESKLNEVMQANPGIESLAADVSSAEEIRKLASEMTARYPGLNAVFHVAGVMISEDLLNGSGLDTIDDKTIATNLLGPIRLTEALLPALLKQPAATIMTVTSGLAFTPLAMTPTYCATKAAIHSYTESLRYQLKDTAVQVIELVPPYVQTELMGSRQANDPNAMPLNEYIAEAMSLLKASPEANEILVERVKQLRFAEANGGYDAFFTHFNDAMTAASSAH